MADFYRKLLVTETEYFTSRIAEFTNILDELTAIDSVDASTQPNSNSSTESTAASPEVIESGMSLTSL